MLKIYTASWCTHCSKLKAFLKNKGIGYVDVDIDVDIDEAMTLIDLGLQTIPQVFLPDGKHLGGCDVTIEHLS